MIGHVLGEGEVFLGEGLDGTVILYGNFGKVVTHYHHLVGDLFFRLVILDVEVHPEGLCKLCLAGKGCAPMGVSIDPTHWWASCGAGLLCALCNIEAIGRSHVFDKGYNPNCVADRHVHVGHHLLTRLLPIDIDCTGNTRVHGCAELGNV